MRVFGSMDLYKAMILGSLLLLPAAGGFIYWVDGRLAEARSAIEAAKRPGGEIERIGKLEQQLETIRTNVARGGAAEDHRLYFEQRILGSTQGGYLSSTDFQIQNPTESRVGAQKAVDQEVKIVFRRENKPLELPRDFIHAVLYNCEALSQVWKLRKLDMVNAAAKDARSGRQSPPRTVTDDWVLENLVFARREPDDRSRR